jgi:aminomethyltransferase
VSLQGLKSTPLLLLHQKQNAKIVSFAGWQMPLEYAGILEEHRAVRQDKGLFDLSHMGEIELPKNNDGFEFLQSLITNDLSRLVEGQALYTVMCNPKGGILDDMVVYHLSDKFLLVVNASNTEKIFQWMKENNHLNVPIWNRTDETALLAIQGPNAENFLQSMTNISLSKIPYYHAVYGDAAFVKALISRTGYTGEDGFELYVQAEEAPKLWEALLEKKIQPVGLGARDTLRLEAGYLLYGNDMTEANTPLEAGLAWVVKFEKNFIGREALLQQKEKGVKQKLVAFVMEDRALPRKGYRILSAQRRVGEVTSGTFSPTLQKGIGLGYVEVSSGLFKEGALLEIEVRDKTHPAKIVKKPFVKGSVKSGS